jgi:FXSXX-COOH protein
VDAMIDQHRRESMPGELIDLVDVPLDELPRLRDAALAHAVRRALEESTELGAFAGFTSSI